jgi:hypothetical protein
MKRRIGNRLLVGVFVAAWALGGSTSSARAQDTGPGCSLATLNGAYGAQMQGTRPVPMGVGTESVVGVVVRMYDGMGNVTQIDNVKGSVSGIGPPRQGSGTYQVNADCSAVAVFSPGPGITIEERMVIVEGGAEILSITASPPDVMVSAVQKRITATPAPPTPPTQPAIPCPGTDPFAGIPGLIGDCVNGGWVPRQLGG